jgi:hypothetical protein
MLFFRMPQLAAVLFQLCDFAGWFENACASQRAWYSSTAARPGQL